MGQSCLKGTRKASQPSHPVAQQLSSIQFRVKKFGVAFMFVIWCCRSTQTRPIKVGEC